MSAHFIQYINNTECRCRIRNGPSHWRKVTKHTLHSTLYNLLYKHNVLQGYIILIRVNFLHFPPHITSCVKFRDEKFQILKLWMGTEYVFSEGWPHPDIAEMHPFNQKKKPPPWAKAAIYGPTAELLLRLTPGDVIVWERKKELDMRMKVRLGRALSVKERNRDEREGDVMFSSRRSRLCPDSFVQLCRATLRI